MNSTPPAASRFTQPPPASHTPGRVLAVVAAGVIALVSLGLLTAGGVMLWGDAQRDSHGYVSTGSDPFTTDTYALATDNLDVNADGPGWVTSTDTYGKIRLAVASHTDKPVFVGIAPTSEVSRYLQGSSHDIVEDVSYSPFSADYRHHGGTWQPAAPATKRFWAASAQGTGAQTLTWDVRDGNWSIVVMNADASRGVDVGMSAGAKIDFLAPAGWTSLGGGVLLLVAAAGLLYAGVRPPRPRRPYVAPAAPAPVAA
jgi:hypothetical protein